MKIKTRSFFALTNGDIDQLENRLIQKKSLEASIEEMQELFIQSKVLEALFKEEQERKAKIKESAQAAKKRISQIQQLSRVVNKQTSLMKSETSKITEALALNKILTMEKLLRMQRETQQIQRKRQVYRKTKNENQIQNQLKKIKMSEKLERIRLESLNNSVNMRNQLDEVRCNTMQIKRRQVEEVKLAHERQKSRSNKIATYKRLRARNNYLSKIQQIREEINQKQGALEILCQAENQQQIKVGSTVKVTEQYLHSFFPTQDASI